MACWREFSLCVGYSLRLSIGPFFRLLGVVIGESDNLALVLQHLPRTVLINDADIIFLY